MEKQDSAWYTVSSARGAEQLSTSRPPRQEGGSESKPEPNDEGHTNPVKETKEITEKLRIKWALFTLRCVAWVRVKKHSSSTLPDNSCELTQNGSSAWASAPHEAATIDLAFVAVWGVTQQMDQLFSCLTPSLSFLYKSINKSLK